MDARQKVTDTYNFYKKNGLNATLSYISIRYQVSDLEAVINYLEKNSFMLPKDAKILVKAVKDMISAAKK